VTPVARDTFNTMAEATQQTVETLAHAVGRGFAGGTGATVLPDRDIVVCEQCHAPNPTNARFCSQCGTALQAKTCPGCGATQAPTARFCNQCGQPID
jgi:ribosomal protein L40E